VLAPTKRRRVSFYLSLPVVIAMVFLLVARLVAMQRADIIADLTDRVAHRDTPEASAAVRQLAAMPRPPVAVLVAASTAVDRVVAEEAQQAISKLLRRWQRQVEAERSVGAVARQLHTLAEALAAQRDSFSAADHSWLAGTTHKIVRIANRIPSTHTPLVAMHCDAILAAAATHDVSPAKVVDKGLNIDGPVGGKRAMPGESGPTGQIPLRQELAAASTTPLEAAMATEPTSVSIHVRDEEPADTPSNNPMDASWRAGWSHPVFRIMPAMPIDALRIDGGSPPPVPSLPEPKIQPDDSESTDRPLAGVDSRILLGEWLAAEGTDVYPVEQELTQRGFGRLSERLVQQLFSDHADDRLRLVDDVLTEPGINARPWLMLLADDANADVRLLAVTIMATSNDAALVEKAWQVAIRDRDPRIAGLAERLRERRGNVNRR
jgi:hypothetical protein